MALVTGAPRSADARASQASELLGMDRENLQRLERGHPLIAVALLRAIAAVLATRLSDTTGQLRELSRD
jgi:CRP-like cAMP-binding protein